MKLLHFCAALTVAAGLMSLQPVQAELIARTSTKSPAIENADSLLYEARKAKGLPNVAKNPRLKKAAEAHTKDMIAMGKLTHTGRNGSNSRDRMKAQGYQGCFFAENIAKTSGDVVAAFDVWMKSKAHRSNIQSPNAKEYGIYTAKGYWTLVLASPC